MQSQVGLDYIYICICVCVYIYIYIYRERERERELYDDIHLYTCNSECKSSPLTDERSFELMSWFWIRMAMHNEFRVLLHPSVYINFSSN